MQAQVRYKSLDEIILRVNENCPVTTRFIVVYCRYIARRYN